MKKISNYVVALLVVFACAVFVSCANSYTLGLNEVGFEQISNNASGDYTLTTLTVRYDSNGAKTGESSSVDGVRSSNQLKAEVGIIKLWSGAKSYANSDYSKIVLYKCVTNDSGVKTAEYWYQYKR